MVSIQLAIAGMKAPSNTICAGPCRHVHGARTPADSAGVHEDYNTVNEVLASVEAEIRRSFLTEVENPSTTASNPRPRLLVGHRGGSWLCMADGKHADTCDGPTICSMHSPRHSAAS